VSRASDDDARLQVEVLDIVGNLFFP